MTDVDRGAHYTAFLSYSHRDAAVARWLHRKLETYRIPGRLVGSEGERGEVPARLTPIFRDREELPAAGDLSEKVRAALAASENLIVICSPSSAASPWVAREIAAFRELHPGRPIFAAIVEGEPDQSFPPILREGGAEPLAADLRRDGDGRRLGLLKLAAGLAGVGLDALVQRDAARRIHRVTAVTGAALAAMLVMAVLTAFALSARSEAQHQRAQAEGLVEFMLTDLRTKLKGVKRLDIFAAVNARALHHYAAQDLGDLPPDALERRARLLHQIGEDDVDLGRPDRALAHFREAARTTAALLADDPDNPTRIFAQSQSEFWLGSIPYGRSDYNAAKVWFNRYKALADRLVSIDPVNAEWVREAGYAEGVLCTIAMSKPVDARAALANCSQALAHMQRTAQLRGRTPAVVIDLANRHGWMVDALAANGRWSTALSHRSQHELLVQELIRSDPKNFDYRDIWMRSQFGFGKLLADRGSQVEAQRRFADAAATAAILRRHDPANAAWVEFERRALEAIKKGGQHGH